MILAINIMSTQRLCVFLFLNEVALEVCVRLFE